MEEIWKDIEEYEGLYQVSNFGDVKSLGNNKTRKEKVLKPIIDVHGYYDVKLSKNGKCKTIKNHKLVAMAFLGHIPDGLNIVVNHIDNNKLNNHVDNLELVSNRYNTSCHKNNPGVQEYKNRNLNKKFRVQIRINNKIVHIGMYKTIEEANQVYQLAYSNVHLFNGDKKEFRELIKTLYHV